MELVKDKKNCCGCSACYNICPQKAISMKLDEEGFGYPTIDKILCINCGLCKRVCAFQNGYDKSKNIDLPYAYAVKHKDLNIRMNSRSGGMFSAISDYILDNNGIVYGAGYREHFTVSHKRATTKLERNEFRGSKYVQSEMNDIYAKVRKDLIENKLVLFSGTPCQTAGLNSYLNVNNIDVHKLILCDIICHGTPSPLVWKDYLHFIEYKFGGKVDEIDFRNKKRFGWADHRETFRISGKEYHSKLFTTLFYKHDILRPACFNCKYTNMKRPSDITLGDFWGIDESISNFNDDKGVSLVFINTEKGKYLFEKIRDKIYWENCTGDSFVHPNLNKPTEKPLNREKFWNNYKKYGFKYIIKKYSRDSFNVKIKNIIINILKRFGLFEYVKKIISKS